MQQGELARLRVLGGPDSGVVFVILSHRVVIGRGEENDVLLTDLNTSRRHAELSVGPLPGEFTLKDLGSQNGLLVNGVPQKVVQVKTGDKIGLGKSVLEFLIADPSKQTHLTTVPSQLSKQVGTGESGLTHLIQAKSLTGSLGLSKAKEENPLNKPGFIQKNKKLIYGLSFLMALAALLPEVEERQKASKKKYQDPKEVQLERFPSSVQPPEVVAKAFEKSDIFFKEGFREFRAKNFSRAIVAFETALQIYREHSLARIYLQKTKKEMEEQAKQLFEFAKRDEEANRLKSALDSYEAVKRLYVRNQSHEIYKEAERYETDLKKKMKEAGIE